MDEVEDANKRSGKELIYKRHLDRGYLLGSYSLLTDYYPTLIFNLYG